MKKTYQIEVLTGTVYSIRIQAENLEEALEIGNNFDPHHRGADAPEWREEEADRTLVIGSNYGRTTFGFGISSSKGIRS
jgi:hypothetical protein